MRIAIISDVHGNVLALEAVLADIARQGAERIVDLGDRVSGPLWPKETFDRLKSLGIPGVRGNHDRIVGEDPREGMGPSDAVAWDMLNVADRAELAALPVTAEFVPGLGAFHATPTHDDRYTLDDIHDGRLHRADIGKILRRLGGFEARIILMGHSHRPELLRLPDGRLLLNPGSVGDPGYEDTTGQRHVSEAGTPHARYVLLDIADITFPDVTFRAVPYDFERAARQAEKRGRREWAHALRTGLMPRPA
ncbi:MAG TPA: metallophosphoesterase family protein [Rhabdaerophilum sp.]|nr:metallophosphoesterase family protein [Rhabdaerophilum sp.]